MGTTRRVCRPGIHRPDVSIRGVDVGCLDQRQPNITGPGRSGFPRWSARWFVRFLWLIRFLWFIRYIRIIRLNQHIHASPSQRRRQWLDRLEWWRRRTPSSPLIVRFGRSLALPPHLAERPPRRQFPGPYGLHSGPRKVKISHSPVHMGSHIAHREDELHQP